MDENLISKKELLEVTGISYGALYRWKRKNLIPEEWFIRKSTFTGQETFFPRNKILDRISKIQNMKEELSLDDMAGLFSLNLKAKPLSKDELIAHNIVNKSTIDFLIRLYGDIEVFPFEKILYICVLDKALQMGDISLEEGKLLLETLEEHYNKYENKDCDLVFLRKMGISTCFLVSSPCEYYFEKGTRIVSKINITNCIEELKINLS
ncbi:MAG: YhbD family protein [Methanosarcina sp.]